MNIHVTYMAQLRRLTGKASEEVSLPEESNVADLLRRIARHHGEALAAVLLDARGQARPSVLVFRADEQVAAEVALSAGDRLTLLTPMAGG